MQNMSYSSFASTTRKKSKKKLSKSILDISIYLLGLVIVVMLGIAFSRAFGTTTVALDQSMSPTLKSEDTVLINRFSYKIGSPSRMDVVAMKIGSSDNSPTYIRRIIGIPGDTVKISDGKIYVNEEEVTISYNEEAIEDAGAASDGITLDEDTYFVLCDDYNNSKDDSRLDSIGTVSTDQIIGKVWLKILPFSDFGFVK